MHPTGRVASIVVPGQCGVGFVAIAGGPVFAPAGKNSRFHQHLKSIADPQDKFIGQQKLALEANGIAYYEAHEDSAADVPKDFIGKVVLVAAPFERFLKGGPAQFVAQAPSGERAILHSNLSFMESMTLYTALEPTMRDPAFRATGPQVVFAGSVVIPSARILAGGQTSEDAGKGEIIDMMTRGFTPGCVAR